MGIYIYTHSSWITTEILFNLMRSYVLGYTGLFFQEIFFIWSSSHFTINVFKLYLHLVIKGLLHLSYLFQDLIWTDSSLYGFWILHFNTMMLFFSTVSWPLCHQPSWGKPVFKICFKSRSLRVVPFYFLKKIIFANWSVVI